MYEFMIFCIVAFLWLCGSVFSFVSYIATHKIRKIRAFNHFDTGLLEILFLCMIGSPIVSIITWLSCAYDIIQDKFDCSEKINEWTSK